MMNRSLFIIKPDAYKRKEYILRYLRADFVVSSVKEFLCTADITAKLYPSDVRESYFVGICDYMLEANCVVGRLQGENVLQKFFIKAGMKADPLLCEKGTLRNTYGKGSEMTASGIIIVKNAIHRPKSIFELLHDEEIFSELMNYD